MTHAAWKMKYVFFHTASKSAQNLQLLLHFNLRIFQRLVTSLDGSTLRTLLSAQGFLNHPPTNKFVVFPSRKKDRSVIPQRGKPRLCNSQKIHIKKSTEFKNYFQNLLQKLSFELKLLCHLISIFCLITINSPLTSSVQHINSLSDLYSL